MRVEEYVSLFLVQLCATYLRYLYVFKHYIIKILVIKMKNYSDFILNELLTKLYGEVGIFHLQSHYLLKRVRNDLLTLNKRVWLELK